MRSDFFYNKDRKLIKNFCENRYLTKLLGFDKVLPMNTGVEGGETSIKVIIFSN